MANMWVTLGTTRLFPSFPIDVSEYPVGDELRMANGNERFYHRADRREWVLTREASTEADRTSWRNASPLNASISYTDEHGTVYTVRVVNRNIPLVATQPISEGSESSTGPAEYTITITLRQIQ
jgi:hypothetical protein